MPTVSLKYTGNYVWMHTFCPIVVFLTKKQFQWIFYTLFVGLNKIVYNVRSSLSDDTKVLKDADCVAQLDYFRTPHLWLSRVFDIPLTF